MAQALDAKRQQAASPDDHSGTKEFVKPEITLIFDRRELLYTIAHAGSDHILLSQPDNPEKQRVIATAFISTIRWNEGPQFAVGFPRPQVGRYGER